jgi:hypothetical protein
VRRQEAWALAQNRPEGADASIIPTLIDYIQDPDAEVRWAGETAITRIALSEEAINSGLRSALRDNETLTSTLLANVDYVTLDLLDRKVRAQALDAIRFLYLESPRPAIEQLAVDRWADENHIEVMTSIVYLLCEHRYQSQGTIDVFTEASGEYYQDTPMHQAATECLAAIAP